MPLTGIPYRLPASTFDVPRQPPMNAALAPLRPAFGPWARRSPKSTIGAIAAALTILFALVAIIVWKLTRFNRAVSASWAWINVEVTLRMGVLGATGAPSGTAQTSPVNLISLSQSRKYSGNP